jgi:SagB-type dehydrogenase family enzyme
MYSPYLLKFRNLVQVRDSHRDIFIFGGGCHVFRIFEAPPWTKKILGDLSAGESTADEICSAAADVATNVDVAEIFYFLGQIEGRGLLTYTLTAHGTPTATLEPSSARFSLHAVSSEDKVRLSRFAYMRRADDSILLESAIGCARIIINDPSVAKLAALLVVPHSAIELAAAAGCDVSTCTKILFLLINARVAQVCSAGSNLFEDNDSALRHWAFHDLLFHVRSRRGRHDYPTGASFPFRGELPPAARKPATTNARTVLYKPSAEALNIQDVPFNTVLEGRRSLREPGPVPLSLLELGEFLYRVARVKQFYPADPERPLTYDSSMRPCPGTGAIHEIELYLTIARCDGIDAGLYYYDAFSHQLEKLGNLGSLQQQLLADARNAAGTKSFPDVLIVLAARYQRLAWKYESIVYASILKDAGILQQQMYLVATAMRLAPCALGCGDSDAFARATTLDYYAETSVAEFMLSRH